MYAIFILTVKSRKRHLYYAGRSQPLTVEVSRRSSHRLVSHILKILLHEVVGYEHVNLKYDYNSMNTEEILQRLSGCDKNHVQIG